MKRSKLLVALLTVGSLSVSPLLAQDQVITLTTSKAVGEQVVLRVNQLRHGVTVDWGDGVAQSYSATDDDLILLQGTVKGTQIKISGDKKLNTLVCDGNQLTAIDLSQAPNLRSLYCQNNELTALDIEPCPSLTDLNCANNQLSQLRLTADTHPYIENVNIAGNQLRSLAGSGGSGFYIRHSNVQQLNLSDNLFTLATFTGNENLDLLKCVGNRFSSSLSVTACDSLTTLMCNDNQLTRLILPSQEGLPRLQQFMADGNRLTTLDLSASLNLKALSVANNELTQVTLPPATRLQSYSCGGNKLSFSSFPSANYKPENISYTPQDETWDISSKLISKKNTYFMTLAPSWSDRNKSDYQLDLQEWALDPDGERTITFTWYGSYDGGEIHELEVASTSNKEGDYFPAASTANYGKFSFLQPQDQVYCLMSSSVYPDLTFRSTAFEVKSADIINGISHVTLDGSRLRIQADRGSVSLRTTGGDRKVDIFTTSGQRVWTGWVGSVAQTVQLPAGVYVVGAQKVIVR